MRRKYFIAGLGAAAASPGLALAASDRADLIVTAASIHTVDARVPTAEAFAVRNGRILYAGSRVNAMAYRGPRAQVLDFGKATILPGLIDAHLHLIQVGQTLHEVDLYHVATFDEVMRRTVAFARTTSDAWVLGDGWDQNLWPGKAFPTHDALSAALPDRPVLLGRVDGHAVLANAKAMELAGVNKSTPDPSGGKIERDANGNPTGVFIDNAMTPLWRAVPAPTHEQLVRALTSAIKEAHRWGLTTVSDPGAGDDQIAAYEELGSRGQLSLRTYVMLADKSALLQNWFQRGPVAGAHGDRLWIRTVKMFADGALGSRGAALLAPYSDDPGNTGLMRVTGEHIQSVTSDALHYGFQACTHAIGDRGNRTVLDAYEAALKNTTVRDHRLRIEHAQILSLQDIPRFAQLGVIPSMQTTHQISDMGWAEARLGPERIRGAYAWRTLLDTGVIIANGTDAPVESVNTLRTFHSAISRQNEADQPPGGWYAAQRMNRDEALKSMTIWAAHANFQERVIGSLSPGKYADFTVVSDDWMRAAPESIMKTSIVSTYSAGKNVYDARTASASTAFRPRSPRFGSCCGHAIG